MKKLLAVVLSTALATGLTGAVFAADMKKVYVNQIVEHPALDMTAKGIRDGLKERGYVEGENLDFVIESAQANVALASQISTKFVAQNADVTVGIGTPSAQSLVKAAMDGKTKMVFSSITDPLAASLVKSLENSNTNVTGMSNFVEVAPQLEMIKTVLPEMKKLGFIYNPGEANSISQLEDLQKAAPQFGIEIITQAVNRTADVPQAATRLASQADAIFIYGDNTALAALESIVIAGIKQGKPVFVADTDAVPSGPLAALGPNQYQLGIDTAMMIADILEGTDINTIPVGFPGQTELVINLDSAKKLGIELPATIIDSAAVIIEDGQARRVK